MPAEGRENGIIAKHHVYCYETSFAFLPFVSSSLLASTTWQSKNKTTQNDDYLKPKERSNIVLVCGVHVDGNISANVTEMTWCWRM